MENIVILAEWHGNSWGGSNIMTILLGAVLVFIFSCYIASLFTDEESYTLLLILSAILAFFSFNIDSFFFFMFFANIVCHMIVDNAKANDKIINLVQDQSAHIAQIAWTWFLCL